ncbi:Extracellular Matrix protein PelD [hydrothermal vent metagenome]|uniref:Extracellular Matrix protein PelD n=1 Tax=hydrothermal vent metagenome TaxID=652676 RepID=A0A3B1BCY9_9ZZZZ
MEPLIYRNRLEKLKQKPGWHAWFEMFLITLITLGLSAWSRPDDPFFIQSPFPWPLLGPVIVGLRYGFFFGFISDLVVLAVLALSLRLEWVKLPVFPYDYAIGLTAVAMLVGEFRDVWRRRIERLQESNDYRQIRLNEFTHNYHLLKVSHDRLEQQVAGSGRSLREGLRFIRTKLSAGHIDGLDTDIAQTLLAMMVEYGNLQKAALFASQTDKDKHPTDLLMTLPQAQLGISDPLRHNDPLIRHCIKTRKLVSIHPEQFSNEDTDSEHSQLLACVPLIDAENQLWAVIAIEMMPFFSFQKKTLRLLAILAGHMADLLNTHSVISSIADEDFASLAMNLKRAMYDQIEFSIPSVLLVFDVNTAEDGGQQFIELIQRMQRGLDIIVHNLREQQHQLIILLPLTDELGLAGYRQRLENLLKSDYGVNLATLPVKTAQHQLQEQSSLDQFITQRIWDGDRLAHYSSHSI